MGKQKLRVLLRGPKRKTLMVLRRLSWHAIIVWDESTLKLVKQFRWMAFLGKIHSRLGNETLPMADLQLLRLRIPRVEIAATAALEWRLRTMSVLVDHRLRQIIGAG